MPEKPINTQQINSNLEQLLTPEAIQERINLRQLNPDFQDLIYWSAALEKAIKNAFLERLLKATHVIASIRERSVYLETFRQFQPGAYFCDLGELLRIQCAQQNEESRSWEHIDLYTDQYKNLLNAYTSTIKPLLSLEELEIFPQAGRLMTYQQLIRFTVDYLQNDISLSTLDADHNLHRAFNQLILLEKMEAL